MQLHEQSSKPWFTQRSALFLYHILAIHLIVVRSVGSNTVLRHPFVKQEKSRDDGFDQASDEEAEGRIDVMIGGRADETTNAEGHKKGHPSITASICHWVGEESGIYEEIYIGSRGLGRRDFRHAQLPTHRNLGSGCTSQKPDCAQNRRSVDLIAGVVDMVEQSGQQYQNRLDQVGQKKPPAGRFAVKIIRQLCCNKDSNTEESKAGAQQCSLGNEHASMAPVANAKASISHSRKCWSWSICEPNQDISLFVHVDLLQCCRLVLESSSITVTIAITGQRPSAHSLTRYAMPLKAIDEELDHDVECRDNGASCTSRVSPVIGESPETDGRSKTSVEQTRL
nr:hypothetical protein CFP56_00457 [Quercus suber]